MTNETKKLYHEDFTQINRELLFNYLISPEFTIIYNAIKNSNKISKNTHRTIRPEIVYDDDTQLKITEKFITRAAMYPNSVEVMALGICQKYYNNISKDNSNLMKEIYKSSLKVSFMGATHAKKNNLIFDTAPKNSRRAKIFDTIKKYEDTTPQTTISIE